MAVTATVYNYFKKNMGEEGFDFTADSLKVALCTSSYTPDIDTHEDFADITNEITGTGYTAGGVVLTGVTWAIDTALDRAKLSADNATWAVATFTARYAIVYYSTGTAATSLLIGYIDFGADQSPSAEDFVIAWASTGALYSG